MAKKQVNIPRTDSAIFLPAVQSNAYVVASNYQATTYLIRFTAGNQVIMLRNEVNQ